jgi:ribosome-binding factor A
MHRTIARILNEEFKDPRIGMVTVTSVEVSRDLSYAKVFVTVFEEAKVEETLKVLNQAAGFFRAQLAKSMHLRVVPRPHFIFDESVVRGSRMASLLASIPKEEKDNDSDA